MKKLCLLGLLGCFLGCEPPPPPQPFPEKIVKDYRGFVYRLVSPEKTLNDGSVQVELWERIDPLETNRWYTPTLSTRIHGGEPIFNSISK